MESRENSIDVVFSPALIPTYSKQPAIAVVIDVFRASTTIITALQNGAKMIKPLEMIGEAQKKASEGAFVGAERNVVRCDFARTGNDPAEYTRDRVQDETIYFTTTNGTRTIKRSMEQGHEVIVGSFMNLGAVADYCKGKDVLCMCAGWEGKFCKEDALFGAALVERLTETHRPASDAAAIMLEAWEAHKGHLMEYLMQSDHYPRLVKAGKESNAAHCLDQDLTRIVPVAHTNPDGEIELHPFIQP